jgi:hypothetical protein
LKWFTFDDAFQTAHKHFSKTAGLPNTLFVMNVQHSLLQDVECQPLISLEQSKRSAVVAPS